jgi:CheY-like chemotaxis protein
MPRTDGESAFRQLRANPATASIPVVAVTADVLTWPESRSLREGFAGHVTKPCDLSRIRDVVARIIGPADAAAVPQRAAFVAAAMH